jgi:parvulin-like peptidyl-prolyl isomerase
MLIRVHPWLKSVAYLRMQVSGLVIYLIGAAAGLPLLAAALPEPRSAVARVNGAAVTSGELDEEIDRLAPSSVTAHSKSADKAALRKKALDELIIRELAYQKAKQQKLSVPAAEMNATVAKIKGRYKGAGSFSKALAAEQISEQEFRQRVEKDLLLRKIYKREIDDKADITRSEADAYYRDHKDKFLEPESAWLLQVYVRESKEAKSKADEALAKLKSGTPFFDVAYTYSEDDYRVVGGDYGWVHLGQLSPEVEKLVFTAPAKKLIGPVHTSFGWHIVQVQEHRPARQLPLEEVRPKISDSLHQNRLARAREDFQRRLRENARIEYLAP